MIHQQSHKNEIKKDKSDSAINSQPSNDSSMQLPLLNSTPTLSPPINDPADPNNQTAIFSQFQHYSINPQQQQQPLNKSNLMHLPLHQQNALSNRLQPGISQPSDPALQRLGLNRRVSAHMQRLPSLTNIHNSSPSMSPNGKNIVTDNINNIPQLPQLSSQLTSPEKPVFKNVWGFNDYSDQISPTSSNFAPMKNNYQSPISSNYQQQRMNSISGFPSSTHSTNSNASPLRGSVNVTPANLSMSSMSNTLEPHHDQMSSFANLRSNSFAVPQSKFNTLTDNTVNNSGLMKQKQLNQLQQQKVKKQFHNQQLQLLQLQQQQLQQRRFSQQYEPRLSNFSSLNSLNVNPHMNYNSHVNSNISTSNGWNYNVSNNSFPSIESQQQQIIPPLRALNPVQSYNDINSFNANNAPRRESVAAVYHNQRIYDNDIRNDFRNNRQASDVSKMSIDDLNELYNQQYGMPNFLPDNEYRTDSNGEVNFQYDMNYGGVDVPRFQKVNTVDDLSPVIHEQPKYRRLVKNDTSGVKKYVSPMKALTSEINTSYSICVPEYDYHSSKNPRRVLTKNNKPFHNNGYDNESYDYILYVNDILGTEENKKYLVIDILGQGTFGQVVKCQNLKTNEIVAIKVVKARQECLQQSITEGNILEYLSKRVDPKYEKYFISLKDKFMHKYHLCLVFELLSSNLYELIKQNHHHGLNIKLVKNFAIQILESLCALKDIKLIHCDLKPENILLKSLDKPDLKIIDFGSACQERQTLYTYVQSRFYRSPEVILGVEYSTSVDMWSFGCIIAELFLGLPIFPGASEYEQLVRIVETFGMPPAWMMVDKKSNNYIVKERNLQTGKTSFRLKSLNEFNTEFNLNESPPKQYFSDTKIDDIIMNYRISKRKNMTQEMIDVEMHERSCLVHFLKGIMNINPLERWTPHEAVHHPFVTNEPWLGHWYPPTAIGQPSHAAGRSRSLV